MKKLLLPLAILISLSLTATQNAIHGQGWSGEISLDAAITARPETTDRDNLTEPKKIRPAAGAGSFYPAEAKTLYDQVAALYAAAPPLGLKGVNAILVPHAGYIYSGKVAAAAFREVPNTFKRVFILAANHNSQADYSGVSIPDATHYAIPGAEIPLDSIVDLLHQEPGFTRVAAAHTMYMIEAELPFLLYRRGLPAPADFTIVPMVLGRMDDTAVRHLAATLNRYAAPGTLFVFSADLSHFYTDEQARRLDNYTIQTILERNLAGMNQAVTDGNQVLRTMLELAELQNWDATRLAYANSGDVNGDKQRVVGYGAIAFHEPFWLTATERRALLGLARRTIAGYLTDGRIEEPAPTVLDENPIYRIPRGIFVTLKKNGQLRGCIGELISAKPLYKGVQSCAVKSAVSDSRFEPVRPGELDGLTLSISILEYPRRIRVDTPEQYPDKLHPGRDGVILLYKGRQSTYLPQVWEQLPDPRRFLENLCLKQGSPAGCWQEKDAELYRYGAYEFDEES